jgi:hypothetical protein
LAGAFANSDTVAAAVAAAAAAAAAAALELLNCCLQLPQSRFTQK